jgi:hypothetical protein
LCTVLLFSTLLRYVYADYKKGEIGDEDEEGQKMNNTGREDCYYELKKN